LGAVLGAAAGGRAVLVTGEAGIGKSALVGLFTERHSADARFLFEACDPLLTPRALGPLHDVARQTGGRLAELLRAASPREQLFAALLDELDRQARPQVVVVEDAQSGDKGGDKGDWSGSESKGNSATDASSRTERGALSEYAAAMKDGGMPTKDAASAPGKDGSGDANQTHDPRADAGGQGQSSAGGESGKGTETKAQESNKVETQSAKTKESTKSEAGGKGAEQAKPEAGGVKGQEAKGQGETKDKRTDEQIGKELEQRTGKSVGELILSLGKGPVQINMRDLEKALEANGTIKHRTEDNTPPKVIDNVIVQHPYQPGRLITEGKVGTEADVDRAKQQGREEAIQGIWGGIKSAVGGLAAKGSASDGLVKPNPEAQPRTYEPKTGAHKPDAPTMREMAPMRPGEANEARGFQNEKEVARVTGGTLARGPEISEKGALKDAQVRYMTPEGHGGIAKVDVYGPKGEYIAVGGPAKGEDLSKTIGQLHDLKRAADMNGVGAQAYFTKDTPPQVLEAAGKVLGAGNVHTFDRPDYKLR
jgi:hypothetical protein